jgi:hypothetical protein
VFAYADDLLLASTTKSGLQALIDVAVSYVSSRGLRFNPGKTSCMIYGKNPFISTPEWYIEGESLSLADNIKYLGSILSAPNGKYHVESRVRATNRSFYALQGAGVCFDGLSPAASAHVFNVAVRTSLLYGCNSVYLSKANLIDLDKTQGKLVKAMLGLPSNCHSSPILHALGIDRCSVSVAVASMDLLKNCLASSSSTASFYQFLLTCERNYTKTLVGRSKAGCDTFNVNFERYIFDSSYVAQTKYRLGNKNTCDNGIVDSIRTLLFNYNSINRNVLRSIVKPF